MPDYILVNNKIPKKIWLSMAQDFRKGRSLPIDTKTFPVIGSANVELHGLLGFIKELSKRAYRLSYDFELMITELDESPDLD